MSLMLQKMVSPMRGVNLRMVETRSHYRKETGYEAESVIVAWKLGWHLGNVIKYVCRYGLKSQGAEAIKDLDKAIDFLQKFKEVELKKIRAGELEQKEQARRASRQLTPEGSGVASPDRLY